MSHTSPLPSSAAAAPHDVEVPPPPPEEHARARALRLRLAHVLVLACMVFSGALAIMPAHVFPHVPAVLAFTTNVLLALALCGPAIARLREGRAPRAAFALGAIPGGVIVFVAGFAFASAVAWIGEALGVRAHELSWAGGLFLTSAALGTLGLFAHTPMGAGAALSFTVLCVGAVGAFESTRARAKDRHSADGGHALAVFPAGVSEPLSLGSSCGSFAVEHVGLAALVRRPVLVCDTGHEWLEPCEAQIAAVTVEPHGYRVALTDGSALRVAADGSEVTCETERSSCRASCRAAGEMLTLWSPRRSDRP